MRVGILTNSYPPNLNGVSVAVVNLEKALIKAGVEVFIATPRIPGVKYPSHVLPIKSAPLPSTISPDLRFPYNYIRQCIKFFQTNQIDILHSQDTMVGGLEAITIAARLKIPAVHTYHTFIEEYDYFKFPGYKQFIRFFGQIVCDGHNAIIAPSAKVRDYLIEHKVSSPIHFLLNILTPPAKVEPGSNIWLKKFPNLNQTFNYLTFGRIAKEKNIQLGINLIAPILRSNPGTKYIIAGSGPYEKELQSQIQELGLTDQIILVGRYDRENLGQLCSLAKVFLITSTSDVNPFTVFEAMYFGLPVTAIEDAAYDFFIQGGIGGRQLREDHITGFCTQLLEDPILLSKLSTQAKAQAKSLTVKNWALDYIQLYNQVIAESKINQLPPNPMLHNLISFQNYFASLGKLP